MGKWLTATVASIISVSGLNATLAGVKGTSMGGACVAYPLDSGVMAYNPSGIVFLCDRVDLALYPVYSGGSTTTKGNASTLVNPAQVNRHDSNRSQWVFSPEVGVVYHPHPNIALGFLLYNEIDLRTNYKRNFPLIGKTPLAFEYTLEIIAPTVAFKFFEDHSISVTWNYLVDRLRLRGGETLANTLRPFSEFPNFVTNNGYNYSNGSAVTLGYQGKFFNDVLRLGFAWRSKAKMSHFGQYKGFIAQRGTFDVPEVIRAGISLTPFCEWTFAFDYQMIHYKQIPALQNDFKVFSPNLLGSQEGSGFGWKNQHYYRFGVNYDFSSILSFRAGFRHANLDFGGKNVAPNILTLETTVDYFTCGATWVMFDNFEVSGLFVYGFNKKRTGPLPEGFGGGQTEIEKLNVVTGLALSWYY